MGVAIETEDIADLEQALAATEDPAVKRVFTNLLNGSLRHLAAFNRQDGSAVGSGKGKGKKNKQGAGGKNRKNNKKRKGGGNKGGTNQGGGNQGGNKGGC